MSTAEHVTVVMIEDDEGHATLIEKNLRRAGISNALIHFSNGKDALDFFKDGTKKRLPMLVLLDLNLPGMDGFEILRHLKDDERTRKIPIIVLTTTDNPREIERCYELGCNVYITKPVDYAKFTESICKLGLLLAVVQIPETKL